jgi:hypothetical protein
MLRAVLEADRRQSEARLPELEKLAAETGDPETRHEAGKLAEELAMRVEPVSAPTCAISQFQPVGDEGLEPPTSTV